MSVIFLNRFKVNSYFGILVDRNLIYLVTLFISVLFVLSLHHLSRNSRRGKKFNSQHRAEVQLSNLINIKALSVKKCVNLFHISVWKNVSIKHFFFQKVLILNLSLRSKYL